MDDEEIRLLVKVTTLEAEVNTLKTQVNKIEKTLDQNRYLTLTTLITALLTLGGIILK